MRQRIPVFHNILNYLHRPLTFRDIAGTRVHNSLNHLFIDFRISLRFSKDIEFLICPKVFFSYHFPHLNRVLFSIIYLMTWVQWQKLFLFFFFYRPGITSKVRPADENYGLSITKMFYYDGSMANEV